VTKIIYKNKTLYILGISDLNTCIERLGEISPQIPDAVIQLFNAKFEKTTPDISKPEITNGLDPIHVYIENSEQLTPVDGSNEKIKISFNGEKPSVMTIDMPTVQH
jgi:hypothetical protein